MLLEVTQEEAAPGRISFDVLDIAAVAKRRGRSLTDEVDLVAVQDAVIEALAVLGFAVAESLIKIVDNGDNTATITLDTTPIDTVGVRAALVTAFAAAGASVSETDYIALVDNGDSTVTVSVVSSTVTDTAVLEAAVDSIFLASLSSTLEVDVTFTSAPEAATIFVLSPPPPAPPAAPSNG